MIDVTAIAALRILDKNGMHTWTVGQEYKITVYAYSMDITNDGELLESTPLSKTWLRRCDQLFGPVSSLIMLYAEEQRRIND